MSDAKTSWGLLAESVGAYSGRGVNHEKQGFQGKLTLQFEFETKLLSLISSATGDRGEVFHTERSWLGFDIAGSLVLYVVSNNHPAITPHLFNRLETGKEGEQKIVFRFGNLEDKNSFREEIHINLFKDKSIEHFYSWGLPGGPFEPRSGSRMQKNV
jgi:hypothetical protein